MPYMHNEPSSIKNSKIMKFDYNFIGYLTNINPNVSNIYKATRNQKY